MCLCRTCIDDYRNASLQVYFYSFDVFRAAGIQEHQLTYTAVGTGLCELAVSVGCVSHRQISSPVNFSSLSKEIYVVFFFLLPFRETSPCSHHPHTHTHTVRAPPGG